MSRIIRLTVSAVLLAWIGWKTNWPEFGKAFAHLRLELWLAGAALFAGCQFISAWRWQRITEALGFVRPMPHLIRLYYIGSYFSMLLPTSVGGDVVRGWYLNNGSGRRLAAFLTVLLDRLSGLLVLLGLACLGVVFSPVSLESWIPWSVVGMTVAFLGGVAMLPLLARWFHLGEGRVEQIKTAMTLIRRPRLFLETSLLSGLVQVGNVAVIWLVGLSLGAAIPGSFYWIMVPMVSLLTMLPISVNGMGVREQSTVVLLAPLGVAQETALTLALLSFAVYTANSLMGGVVYLWGRLPKPGATADFSAEELPHGPLDHHPNQGRTSQPGQAA